MCCGVIEETYSDAAVVEFTDPYSGLEYIVNHFSKKDSVSKVIVLLDISMPVMDGWEFLEQFGKLDQHIKDRVKINILSSSLNSEDMARAQSNKNVEYYLTKPLNRESLKLIVNVLNKRYGS